MSLISRAMPIARFESEGALDTSFGALGRVTTPLNGSSIDAIRLQADGKIVVAGARFDRGETLVARYFGPEPSTLALVAVGLLALATVHQPT